MTVKLNHTIVHSVDKRAAAEFFAGVFGLPAPKPFYDFLDVEVGNEVTLAFLDADGMEIQMQHYAFLVSEKEFDQIFGRIKERGLDYWADPGRKEKGKINRHFGGRGVYFQDPSSHLLEIITRPYGNNEGSGGGPPGPALHGAQPTPCGGKRNDEKKRSCGQRARAHPRVF